MDRDPAYLLDMLNAAREIQVLITLFIAISVLICNWFGTWCKTISPP
jgi:hypothetical protein